MVAGQRVQQRRRLLVQARIGVRPERRGSRPRGRCLQQSQVPDLGFEAQRTLRDMQQLGYGQVDHWPSRSSASAYLGNSSSRTRSSSSARLCASTYSRIACRATSCIGRPSCSARRRSALDSASVNRNVIAMTTMVSTVIPVASLGQAPPAPGRCLLMGIRWYRIPMEAVIDQAGRIVLPKALRDALGLLPGTRVDISAYGAGVQLVPAGRTAQLVEEDGVLVAAGETPVDDDVVFALIDAGRK